MQQLTATRQTGQGTIRHGANTSFVFLANGTLMREEGPYGDGGLIWQS